MAKHRKTPFFALGETSNMVVDESTNLEAHLIEILAIEAMAADLAEGTELRSSKWTTSIDKRFKIDGAGYSEGSMSFAVFRGKCKADRKTGEPKAELAIERNHSLDDYRKHGLFDDLGRADSQWDNDDFAMGINFSRLHRIARLIESRTPDFMTGLTARIEEDMRTSAVYKELEAAAKRRRKAAEEERIRQQEQWQAEHNERMRLDAIRREEERLVLLELKRAAAEITGMIYEDDDQLDLYVTTAVNTTGKGYENEFGATMPEEYLTCGPFTWARVYKSNHKRIFFDVSGRRIPEPS